MLGDIHRDRDRTAIEVLHRYVADAEVVATLAKQLDRSWRDVRAREAVIDSFRAELNTVLGAAGSHGAAATRQRVWSAMITDPTPYNMGALARTDTTRLPWSIIELGLSSIAPQRPPAIAQTADGDRPLDRSVVDRVRATLRRALDRDALPEIPLLCEEEVDRACAPWGLLAEDKQATLVAGIEVAVQLAPLDPSASCRYELATQIRARPGARLGCPAAQVGHRALAAPVVAGQESAAWDHDWSMMSVVVGAETVEAPETRERVRRWARARQNLPPQDAFLAEILAAESAY